MNDSVIQYKHMGLTQEQFDSFDVYMQEAAERCKLLSDGAWFAYMMDSVDQWCESMTTGVGLGSLMYLDPHDAVIMWLTESEAI